MVLFSVPSLSSAELKKLENCYSEISTININKCIQALTVTTEKAIDSKLREIILNYKKSISSLTSEEELPDFHEIMADKTILESQEKWKIFRDAHCSVFYDLEGSGTLRTTIYAECVYKESLKRLSEISEYAD